MVLATVWPILRVPSPKKNHTHRRLMVHRLVVLLSSMLLVAPSTVALARATSSEVNPLLRTSSKGPTVNKILESIVGISFHRLRGFWFWQHLRCQVVLQDRATRDQANY
uniref:Uncharacterized protein n=1 Tax=Triticum urartu TaxID=4572 RepID=A0A8R7QXZ7_TRIUA